MFPGPWWLLGGFHSFGNSRTTRFEPAKEGVKLLHLKIAVESIEHRLVDQLFDQALIAVFLTVSNSIFPLVEAAR